MITELIKKPNLLLPKKHIVLISHMRANTTLLGHIFGSHPDISGYYEQHIGYYSWKSLIRNKMKFSYENPSEPVTKYYFDKILHNEHHVNGDLFNRHNLSLFFMLRKPERTIKSIVELYKKNEPQNNLSSVKFAAQYYIERLEEISKIALKYAEKQNLFYLDSEAIINNTEQTLNTVSSWFNLNPMLSSQYQLFDLSGKRKHGDSSSLIKSGFVSKKNENYNDVKIDDFILNRANEVYNSTKTTLLFLAKDKIIV